MDITQFFQAVSSLLVAAIIALTTWLLRVNVRMTIMEQVNKENADRLLQHHGRLHELGNNIGKIDGQLALITERLQHISEDVRDIKEEIKQSRNETPRRV